MTKSAKYLLMQLVVVVATTTGSASTQDYDPGDNLINDQKLIERVAASMLTDDRSLAELQVEEQGLIAQIRELFDLHARQVDEAGEPLTARQRYDSLPEGAQVDLTVLVLFLQRNLRKQAQKKLTAELDEAEGSYWFLTDGQLRANQLGALFEALAAGQELTTFSETEARRALRSYGSLLFGGLAVGTAQLYHFALTRGHEIRAQRLLEGIFSNHRAVVPFSGVGVTVVDDNLLRIRRDVIHNVQHFWQDILARAELVDELTWQTIYRQRQSFTLSGAPLLSYAQTEGAGAVVSSIRQATGDQAAMAKVDASFKGGSSVEEGKVPSAVIKKHAPGVIEAARSLARFETWRTELASEAYYRAGRGGSRSIYNTGNRMAIAFENMRDHLRSLAQMVRARRAVLENVEALWRQVVRSGTLTGDVVNARRVAVANSLDGDWQTFRGAAYVDSVSEATWSSLQRLGDDVMSTAEGRSLAQGQLERAQSLLAASQDLEQRLADLASTEFPRCGWCQSAF